MNNRYFPFGMLALLGAALDARAQESATTPLEILTAPLEPTANPYTGDLRTRERLTGDWNGRRTALTDRGITFDIFATQFYQGIAEGGRNRESAYGGKLDYFVNLDGHKLGLWEGLSVAMHGETRYGRDINGVDGLITPSNIVMSFPEPGRNISALTGLKVTQAFGETFAVYAGKINTLDEYVLRYETGAGTGKPGLEGFLNTSLVFNPILARTVPYAAAGIGFAILREKEPVFTFTVFDPEERSTKGLENLFTRGVTLMPDFIFVTKFLGRPGLYNFGGTYSNSRYRSFDPAAYLNTIGGIHTRHEGGAEDSPQETGSWSLYANAYQSLFVNELDEDRNWGVFGQFGLSDGNPNPIRFIANGGIGGHSMIGNRKYDTFGIGYFYVGLSDNFKSLARPFQPQRDEYGVELFYNLALRPWCRLTGDLQIARPSSIAYDTAIIPGLRLQILF